MTNENIILYVDDEQSNRLVFEATFEDRFKIHVVDSGENALRFMEEHEVAVVVSDQRMSGMKGNELLTHVRERWPRTIRLIVTAHKDVDAILRAVNDGLVVRYIVKPWDEAELGEMLEWSLQAYALAFASYGSILQARILESEKLAVLGSLQASFLHELGSPLSYIYCSASELELLQDYTADLLDLIARDTTRPAKHWNQLRNFLGDFPEILENLRLGASLLTHLREDVNGLVRKSSEDEVHVCTGEALNRAVRFAISVNKRDAMLAHTEVRYDGPSKVPDLRIAPEDLTLVLINLVRNSIQAHSPERKGNRVVISVEPDEIRSLARLSIADNGKGMSDEVSNVVGKQFFTTRKAGTGLGIFRCKALVGSTGGSLDYDSKLGCGTTVTATIPLLAP